MQFSFAGIAVVEQCGEEGIMQLRVGLCAREH
jgi:hypothetical protein